MKVSLITPTKKRDAFLELLYERILEQTHTDWQWLIADSSQSASTFFSKHADKRICYFHSKEDASVGKKRNELIAQAIGDVIFHFDDDDFYAPTYIETVLKALSGYDFFSIHSWFSYDIKSGEYFYFKTDHPSQTHFILDALSGSRVREIDFGPQRRAEQTQKVNKLGYGFTFAYRKEITKVCHFPDLDIGEDRLFFDKIEKQGFKAISMADQNGIAIKLIHHTNLATVYPQYRLPAFLAKKQLPIFSNYLRSYEDRLSHCRESL